MAKFKDHIIMAAVFGTLGLIGMVMSARHVSATTPPPAGPSVNIASPLPLPVTVEGAVSIANGVTSPVPVSNVDPAVPFQVRGFGDFTSGGGSFFNIATVPAGKRMIIEHVSLSVDVEGTAQVFFAEITSTGSVGAEGFTDYLVPQRTGPNSTSPDAFVWFQASHQTFLYADEGQTVRAQVNKSVASTQGFAQIVISGHLVPLN